METEAVFSYIQSTWLDSSIWAPEEWSVYRQTVRTNNDTEGWHRRLSLKAADHKCSFYVLVPLLRREAEYLPVQAQLVREGTGRVRRNVYVNLDEQLGQLWEEYDHRELTTEDFLTKIGETYAF
ncbi:uncharacterized protein LOC127867754 [Dreissena polymorpha]|uniref:Uncharacterized protein n=1 Tax=Dreissena polymorpha TaxID=45954 RepID=A0A9D4M2N8_DREPO|nr:uncharacterized protein LOC127867754 [Dreissena polymorpha]XP_052265085.1 uncharacterized protein LOC127867754 [Dreissena polymorpha]XP_052265086.1 uncharacterized protein LOC127867754 [Dreissena polymorpha]XP_052265087.1 uncharacterized protein LOC127867754 [Dreissena polymorpha]KAH3868368.1 hypothetical protein DPMN_031513 [Dreissena polymorpha]